MKKLLIIAVLLLSACKETGLAPQVQIPPLPNNLAQKATQLPTSTDLTLQGQVRDNTNNITAYNEKAIQVNNLIDLYNCVRDSINKKEIKCQ